MTNNEKAVIIEAMERNAMIYADYTYKAGEVASNIRSECYACYFALADVAAKLGIVKDAHKLDILHNASARAEADHALFVELEAKRKLA